jgi:hypothetical protein
VNVIILNRIDFQFRGFSNSILKYLASRLPDDVHPSWAIMRVDHVSGNAENGPEEGWDNLLQILLEGDGLFFPFSGSNVGEPIVCADGRAYAIDEDSDREDSDFSLSEVDCAGFLIRLQEDTFTIQSAVCFGGGHSGPPFVEVRNCNNFDEPMTGFVSKFISAIPRKFFDQFSWEVDSPLPGAQRPHLN